MGVVTFGQVEKLVEELPVQDQQRLVQRIGERLACRQDYFARAEIFIKNCLESPIRPANGMESGTEIAEMRDERGDLLPLCPGNARKPLEKLVDQGTILKVFE